jgi:hypothetical protein
MPIAKQVPGTNNTMRIAAWSFLLVGVALLVVAVVYYVRRAIANAKASAEVDKLMNGQTNVSNQPVVVTVPGIPPVQTGANGTPVINQPSQLPEWLVTLLWKANDASDGTQNDNYQCEVSNNIVTRNDDQVRQLKKVYHEWYGRELKFDIQNWKWCGGGFFELNALMGCPNDCAKVIAKLDKV